MEKRKKSLLILALIAVILAGVAVGTYAFKTQSDIAHNIITTPSGIKANVVEYAEDPDNPGQWVPYEDPDGVMPGEAISKIPVVKNTGETSFYTRARVIKEVKLPDGRQGEASTDIMIIRYKGVDGFNTTDWTDGGDGYWYYNHPVAAGEETAPLFDEVVFDPAMENLYQGSTAYVRIHGFAVQSANNTDSALTAKGWPADK